MERVVEQGNQYRHIRTVTKRLNDFQGELNVLFPEIPATTELRKRRNRPAIIADSITTKRQDHRTRPFQEPGRPPKVFIPSIVIDESHNIDRAKLVQHSPVRFTLEFVLLATNI